MRIDQERERQRAERAALEEERARIQKQKDELEAGFRRLAAAQKAQH